MGLTATVMAFSMTAMTACVDGSTDANVNKVIEASRNQSVKAMGIEATINTNSKTTSYTCDDKGVMLEGETKKEASFSNSSTVTEKVNFANFAMDMIVHGSSVSQEYYNYNFMRDGASYYTNSVQEITDFSNVTLTLSQNNMLGQLDALLAQMPEGGASADTLSVISIINLAKIYDGVTFADKKLTVNFNKVAYKLYSEVLEVIENLDDNTTVGDIIGAAPVKNLIDSLTYGTDAKEVFDELVKMLESASSAAAGEASQGSMVEAILAALPQPTEGESVYAYLVRLLGSGELKMLFAQMTGANLTKPVSELTLAEILPLFGIQQAPTMDEIKAMVKGVLDQYVAVTEDKVTVTIGKDKTTEVSAVELVFNVGDDYSVSSVTVNAEVVVSYTQISPTGYSSYVRTDSEYKMSLTANVELAKTEYTLTDISKAKIENS